jgi:hypothetical protein
MTIATTVSPTLREPPLLGRTVVALAVHLMMNTALTGATYDIDGGQQLVEA